jgi:hypothetical protein
MAPLDDTTAATRFDSFDVYRTPYKTIGDHKIEAGILVPKNLKPGKHPLVVKFHGGGLVCNTTHTSESPLKISRLLGTDYTPPGSGASLSLFSTVTVLSQSFQTTASHPKQPVTTYSKTSQTSGHGSMATVSTNFSLHRTFLSSSTMSVYLSPATLQAAI